MKKILAIVLSFAMMISMAVVWSFADSDYSVDGILTVEGNQATLDVSVAVPDGAKLAGIQVDVAYNTDKLTLNEAIWNASGVVADWTKNDLSKGDNAYRFQAVCLNPAEETVLNATADYAKMTFTVAEGATIVDGDVTITINDATDLDANTIADKFASTVDIKNAPVPGKYSVDGVVTINGTTATLELTATVPVGANLGALQTDITYNTGLLTLNEIVFAAEGVVSGWENLTADITSGKRLQAFTANPSVENAANGTVKFATLTFAVAEGTVLKDGDVAIVVSDAATIEAQTVSDRFVTSVKLPEEEQPPVEGYSVDGIIATPDNNATALDISVTVPAGANLAGVMLDIHYDSSKLTVGTPDMSVADGVISGWTKDSIAKGDGVFRVMVYTAAPKDATVLNGTAKVVSLPFTIADGATLEESDISIKVVDATDLDGVTINHRFATTVAFAPEVVVKDDLRAAIAEAKALDPSKFTVDSYQKVVLALIEAEKVEKDENAKQSDVNRVTKALNDAIDDLDPAQIVDGYRVDGVVAVPENNATKMDISVAVPNGANLAAIQLDILYNSAKLSVDSLDKAVANGVFSGWVISSVQKGDGIYRIQAFTSAPTDATVLNGTAVLAALNFTLAEGVTLEDGDITILVNDAADIDANTINNNFATSVKYESAAPVVDKTALNEAIAKAEALNESEYTKDSYKAVADALAAAKVVADNEDATQEDVDAATKALTDAIDALQLIPGTVDKSALIEAIAKAEALNKSEYTESSYQAVADALAAAKVVAEKDNATQEEVDAAAKALIDAMNALQKVTQPPIIPEDPENPDTSDSNVVVYMTIAMISVAAIAAFVAMKKKRV